MRRGEEKEKKGEEMQEGEGESHDGASSIQRHSILCVYASGKRPDIKPVREGGISIETVTLWGRWTCNTEGSSNSISVLILAVKYYGSVEIA